MTSLTSSSVALTGRFESIYANARGNIDAVPWATGKPSAALINWLNAVAPSLIRCGSRICVTGCGLGDDAMAFIHRGYDVTAFDLSPTAIAWAQRRFGQNRQSFECGDLFNAPARWRHRFDLVADINNLHLLPGDYHQEAMGCLAEMMAPHGRLLIIAEAAEQDSGENGNDPNRCPLTPEDLAHHASLAGLALSEPAAVFEDDETDPPALRLRALLERA